MSDLERFVAAQDPVYRQVLAELRAGRKQSHWMWFVFPQLAGLGSSPTARFYALGWLGDARAYLDHATLGVRLRECTNAALASGRPAGAVFGPPDDLKFRSSMTLFARAAPHEPVFARALEAMCGGEADPHTLQALERHI